MPKLFEHNGAQLRGESEEAIEGFQRGISFPYASRRHTPWNWNPTSPANTAKVGWILKRGGKELANFAFSLNPQAISRIDTTRTQMFATRGAFYVDDFGAGPTTIQINQLIGSGERLGQPGGGYETVRQHILRFYDEIYTQAAGAGYSNSPTELFFWDNHLYHGTTERAYVPELVYFPQQGFQLQRAVSQNNVWQATITMVRLNKPENPQNLRSGKPGTKVIIVRQSETLKRLAVEQAGSHASHTQVAKVERSIIELNGKIKHTRTIPIFSPANTATSIGTVTVKSMHVAAGEKIIVPL